MLGILYCDDIIIPPRPPKAEGRLNEHGREVVFRKHFMSKSVNSLAVVDRSCGTKLGCMVVPRPDGGHKAKIPPLSRYGAQDAIFTSNIPSYSGIHF